MYLTTYTLFLCIFGTNLAFADYWKTREDFIRNEETEMVGASIVLNDKESIANGILMGFKLSEYDSGFENPGIFAPGRHFFLSRRDIEQSKVFEFIQKMPKGAALHGHDTALVSEDFLFNLTFRDNLYACTVNGRLQLRFLEHYKQDRLCNWKLISDLRKNNASYDAWVKSQITLDGKNPMEKYGNIDVVWYNFLEIFSIVEQFIAYKSVLAEYFYQALKELYEDNVMYLEFRTTLRNFYDLNGTRYGALELAEFYQDVLNKFKADHPKFLGARLIYAPSRKATNKTVQDYVEIAKSLKNKFPNFLAGFDLVGQEDKGVPLNGFINELEEISSHGIDFFFHSGESNWYGASTDFNLVDAVLLGTKRIGHGFALTKHPHVMDIVKRDQIAIEVCPISNQVLKLVDDLRNHPAATLIARGFPVVISYDDPSFWSTKGLSYDFYMAFMGIASRNSDIRLLKQLAKNSLLYSAMPQEEKDLALELWEKQWDEFIVNIINEYYNISVFDINKLNSSVVRNNKS